MFGATSTPKRATSKIKLWEKFVLLLGSILVALLLAEVGIRLVGYAGMVVFIPNEEWGYLMKPSQKVYVYGYPVIINTLGLRGPEVREPKPRDTKRVVFVGDSVTYGGGRIREEQLFCRVVESLAQREGLHVEAINLSAPGWSPQNWGRYIEKRGLHKADIVVLVLPECDLVRPFATIHTAGHQAKTPPFRLANIVLKIRTMFSSGGGGCE